MKMDLRVPSDSEVVKFYIKFQQLSGQTGQSGRSAQFLALTESWNELENAKVGKTVKEKTSKQSHAKWKVVQVILSKQKSDTKIRFR